MATMTTMTERHIADVTIRESSGRIIALLEAKNPLELTPSWADELLERMLLDSQLAGLHYALVVSQDHGYIWEIPASGPPDAAARTQFDMRPVAERFGHLASPRERLRHDDLKMAVFFWLLNVSLGSDDDWAGLGNGTLQSFLAATKGGTVSMGNSV
jgi:hypothetical protein